MKKRDIVLEVAESKRRDARRDDRSQRPERDKPKFGKRYADDKTKRKRRSAR